MYRRALESITSGFDSRYKALGGNLSVALYVRYKQTHHAEDLDEALNPHSQAADMLLPGANPIASLEALSRGIGSGMAHLGGDTDDLIFRVHSL